LIHDLDHGGAEKVLVNLVNNMDRSKFDITVLALFGGGVNEQFLDPHIRYHAVFKKTFPGNSHLMKLFSPRLLHKWFIKERYDVEVAYLEGPSARIISGCPDTAAKLVTFLHCTMHSKKDISTGFRNFTEAQRCYGRMHVIVSVAQTVQQAFLRHCAYTGRTQVLYNTNESDKILRAAQENPEICTTGLRWCGIGKVSPNKGFDRMIRIQKRLKENGYPSHLYILGKGPQQQELEELSDTLGVADQVTFLGYQTNPYKYLDKCDLFVCASYSEGFSTAATEALIVGTPVCTVEVSGMKEMLGENNKYGIVTDNDEDALYRGIKKLLDDPALMAHYKKQAQIRGKDFSTENTVKAVEEMLMSI
jgi:glycosyltransferase involved in cell wall biosynthesis